jgi:hypothetical protein
MQHRRHRARLRTHPHRVPASPAPAAHVTAPARPSIALPRVVRQERKLISWQLI